MNIKAKRPKSFFFNSEKKSIKPNRKYSLTIRILGKKGKPYSAYFAVIILSKDELEINRHIKWITDFSSKKHDYTIIFSTKSAAAYYIIAYRFNIETPLKSDIEIELPEHSSLKLSEISNNVSETFDDINYYKIPKLPIFSLSQNQEKMLEKKMVWIMGTIRSGSTWLAQQLLKHSENIIWSEPWIGSHLDAIGGPGFEKGPVNSRAYFFSLYHKSHWLPALKKLILTRTYSHAQTLDKNIIIKEPTAAGVSNIIMECFPSSKIIFLLRDGRDVVDSMIDAHKPNSWNKDVKDKPLSTRKLRIQTIQEYSQRFKLEIEKVWKAFQEHDPNLRLLIKYEDLRKDTFSELRKIYDFLGIKIPDEQLKRKIERFDFTKIPDSEKGSGKFARSASPGGWKSNFNKEEQSLMNSIILDTLRKVGYET